MRGFRFQSSLYKHPAAREKKTSGAQITRANRGGLLEQLK